MADDGDSQDNLPRSVRPIVNVFTDFLVDILGSLLPGFVFVATASATLYVWLAFTAGFLEQQAGIESWGVRAIPRYLDKFRIEAFVVFTCFSYVFGTMFFRRDPKYPDELSARYINPPRRRTVKRGILRTTANQFARLLMLALTGWVYLALWEPDHWEETGKRTDGGGAKSPDTEEHGRNDETSGRDAPIAPEPSRVDEPKEREPFRAGDGAVRREVTDGSIDVQFPYKYLAAYLRERGQEDLAEIVTWSPEKGDDMRKRSKVFINTLKARLNFLAPSHYLIIARNEAHVRLSSSLWYTSGAVAFLALCCLLVTVFLPLATCSADLTQCGIVFDTAPGGSYGLYLVHAMPCLLWYVGVLLVSAFLRCSILRFFHYQRVREVVFVLETVHTAQNYGNLNLGVKADGDPEDVPAPERTE